MDGLARLLREGLYWETVGDIMGTPQPAKHLLIIGLPKKAVEELSHGPRSCAFNGSKSSRHA